MSEQKQPSAGEWWECRGTRVRIVGRMSAGDVVCELCDRSISVMSPIDLIGEIWHHLPDCDSFDWQPDDIYESLPFGTKIEAGDEYYDGKWRPAKAIGYTVGGAGVSGLYRRKKQPSEAEYKSPEGKKIGTVKITPVESPDDWVTQDRVPDRPGIDEWRWIYPDGRSSPWYPSKIGGGQFRLHGTAEEGCIFEVRCHRKDLPPLPSAGEYPSNQQLFEMIANLRDQMAAMAKRMDKSEVQQ